MSSRVKENDRRDKDEKKGNDSDSTTRARDRDRDKERDRDRHRPSHGSSKRSSVREKDRTGRPRSGDGRSTPTISNLKNVAQSDITTRPVSESFVESRVSLPYPSFSKAHSREAVGRESLASRRRDVLTPEPTDITVDEGRKSDEKRRSSTQRTNGSGRGSGSKERNSHTRPPSPPLTHDEEPIRRRSTPSSKVQFEDRESAGKTSHDEDKEKQRSRPRSSKSSSSSLRRTAEQHSRTSTKSPRPSTPKFKILDAFQFPTRSSGSLKQKDKGGSRKSSGQHRTSASPRDSLVSDRSTTKSDATYIAPTQPKYQPTVHIAGGKGIFSGGSDSPPPPPPPLDVPVVTPKVDYLLQCGGLPDHVPRDLLGAAESTILPPEHYSPELVGPRLFEPFSRLLDDYAQVMSKNGSLAVATGYRSVARRLLDRLEAVFARDISSETCVCIMCYREGDPEYAEEVSGVSWGEVLELVSGRQDLPQWPPFHIGAETPNIPAGKRHIPMQKLDIDVPKEYREHYIAQSKKTKDAVDKWLSRQPHQTSSPPSDVDDETLAFAMLTHLDDERRDLFRGLLEIPKAATTPKKDTPKPKERPEIIERSNLALQRLYRLARPPRDPETAIYLVNNPQIHHVLATLAAISNEEWDILISGRFDGFLRSGAEDDDINFPPSRPSSRFANGRTSRSSMRSSTTGGSFGAPISIDEESEITALAEIERDIFLGMEALEDAFEALHCKAEAIRRAIRERGAGLTAARARRGGFNGVEVLSGTPVPGLDDDSMTDDGIDDMVSIAPSDSASNISSSRRRRPKRRTERRTPAPVEEEEEEG